jgi:hypothetical protein
MDAHERSASVRSPRTSGARRAILTLVFADFEKLDSVRMLQPCHGLGLGPEALASIAVGKVVAQQHLERHHAVKLGVPGTVDDPHAAPANLAEDLVVAHPQRTGLDTETRKW